MQASRGVQDVQIRGGFFNVVNMDVFERPNKHNLWGG
jgi:hypothetical protein